MGNLLFGVDYYPEHWPEERWPLDAELMQQAGFNTVRLAEFAWSRLEPEAGCFDFGWLDRAIELLIARGMRVILGTPTAAPPIWLIEAHPEILPVNEQGQRASFGGRRHYCPSQPAFHTATRRIVEAMAQHYHAHPGVFAWQIDNEMGSIAGGARCHCSTCQAAFHHWLEQRYSSLEQLNQAWGTVFWSQEYRAWKQIPLPSQSVPTNPGLYLDFTRFTSDNWVSYQRFQLEMLRAHCPEHLLTHNMMGLFPFVDYEKLARDLDIVSWDNYPRQPGLSRPTTGMPDAAHVSLSHDLTRSLKKQPFWVMEQQAGPSGWGSLSPTPLPGELRLWTWQAIARGAEGMIYFRWRTCTVGTEQYWHGILPHDGTPGRRYEEIARTGQEARLLGDLVSSALPAEVALLRSYDTLWAFDRQPSAKMLSYDDQVKRYYRALWRHNIAADVLTENQDWSSYKLLIAPCLFVLRNDVAARLRDWVRAGGTLLLTFRSGVKDEYNRVVDTPLPGALRELAGVRVSDYTALSDAQEGEPIGGPDRLELTLGARSQRVSLDIWMDELALDDTTEVLGRYHGGVYAGSPAVTLHRSGEGRVIYVGTALDAAGLDLLAPYVLEQASVSAGITTPAGVEIVRRVHEGVDHWFILNHTAQPQEITLPTEGLELLSGREVARTFQVPGYDVLVVRNR